MWANVVEVWVGMVEVERVQWWEPDSGSELHEWLEYIFAVRYGRFIEKYVDLGVYRWGKVDATIKFEERGLWFPSREVCSALELEANVHETRLGYLIEARFPGSKERRRRDVEAEELVGRAFSRNLKVAKRRAHDKLYQRTSLSIKLPSN